MLLPGAALAGVATAAMGGAWNFASMFVIRDLGGVGDGVGWPVGSAVLAEEFPRERRSTVQGVFAAGYPLFGAVIGAIVVTQLAVHIGWRPVFPILGAVFLIEVIALWAVLREPKGEERARRRLDLDWRPAISVARDWRVVSLMLIHGGALASLQVATAYNTLFLTRVRHVDLAEAGLIVAIANGVGIVGTLALPALSDYIGRKPAMLAGGVLAGAFLTLYALGNLPLPIAVACLAVDAFCVAVLAPLASATVASEIVSDDRIATTMGAINFAGVIIGTFLLPILAGALGLRSSMMIAAFSAAIAGLLVIWLPETAPRVLDRRRAPATPAIP